eukprot:TRINITY_DN17794_c0_g1_i1.p1 TRINITY_DN17794_c0_g1~~TRINITY_DN17794_c0_g1_i1.p1  ORF type:complete len:437 (+),score=49.10 TRINITY_DN17794_c0_g1_i1:87-1397(+)
MPFMKEGNLKADEHRWLRGSQTSFVELLHHKSAANLITWRAIKLALVCCLVYGLLVFSYLVGTGALSWILYLGAILICVFRVLVVLVLLASAAYGHFLIPVYRKSLIFWSWLPSVYLLLCTGSFITGSFLGSYVYEYNIRPYNELTRLKIVRGLNPQTTPGSQVMDAGLVEFADSVDIDRARGGCFVGRGHHYCVAPIVNGGRLIPSGVGGATSYGTFDYFAVGVDCCTCPNIDFRCGEWDNPLAQGGIRSMDKDARAGFNLAVDDWKANYGKDAGHPVFFNWVQDPVAVYKSYWDWSVYVTTLTTFLWLLFAFTVALLFAQAFQMLIRHDIASPLDTPTPPPGTERIWYWFLPNMLYFAEEERRQYLNLPESEAPFYPEGMPLERYRDDPNYREFRDIFTPAPPRNGYDSMGQRPVPVAEGPLPQYHASFDYSGH